MIDPGPHGLLVLFILCLQYYYFILQKFSRIEKILNSLEPDELFCDPDFPADANSLYFNDDNSIKKHVVWKRPKVSYLRCINSTSVKPALKKTFV